MKEHAKSKAKRNEKSLFEKHDSEEGHSSQTAEQKFETLHTETSIRRRELEEQLEIVRAKRWRETNRRAEKERKQVLINNVTKFKSKKLLGLVIDGNKRNNSQPIGNTDFMPLFCNQNRQSGHSSRAGRDYRTDIKVISVLFIIKARNLVCKRGKVIIQRRRPRKNPIWGPNLGDVFSFFGISQKL